MNKNISISSQKNETEGYPNDLAYIPSSNEGLNKNESSINNNDNKFPKLIEGGDKNYKYSTQVENNNTKINKNNIRYKRGKISTKSQNNKSTKQNQKLNSNKEKQESNRINEDISTQKNNQNSSKNNENINSDKRKSVDNYRETENDQNTNVDLRNYEKYALNSGGEENENMLSSIRFSNGCDLACKIIFYNLIRPIHLYLLFVCVFLSFPEYSGLPKFVSIIIYGVILLTSILIEIIESCKSLKKEILTEQKIKYKCLKDGKIINKKGQNINRGDIIILENGNICPCDIIIIDNSNDECPLYFQDDYISGNYNYNVKYVSNNLSIKIDDVKKEFNYIYEEYKKQKLTENVERKMRNIQAKEKSLIYQDFLLRNNLANTEESNEIRESQNFMANSINNSNKNQIMDKNDLYFKYLAKKNINGNIYLNNQENEKQKEELFYLELDFKKRDDFTYKYSGNNIFEIGQKNLAHCGEMLRNSLWVIGIASSIGKDLNSINNAFNKSRSWSNYYNRRKTAFEKQVNYYFYITLTILLIFSIIAGISRMNYLTEPEFYVTMQYTDKDRYPSSPIKNFYNTLFEYILLMGSMVPYTIFFTLEICLLFQKLYINSDIELYFDKGATIINDSKLIEDLGKVDLILTDKTGTLTKNERTFRYCVIADNCYEYMKGERKLSQKISNKFNKMAIPFTDYDMINSSSYNRSNGIIDSVQYDKYKVQSVQNENVCIYLDRTEKVIEEFWKAIALCHDAIPVFSKNNYFTDFYLQPENNTDSAKYFSNSSDNVTLTEMASQQGFTFYIEEKNVKNLILNNVKNKKNNQKFNLQEVPCEIILGEPGELNEKLLLPINRMCHLKFNSMRKRESVIVQEGEYIKLYVKGSIDEIMPRVTSSRCPSILLSHAKNWIDIVSKQGCRELIVAMRLLTKDELKVFKSCIEEANEDQVQKKDRISKVIDSLESNLTLLGGAFIQEKLPININKTVKDIKATGTKIWMVTGDKISNSYHVGLSTGIIEQTNEIYLLEGNVEEILLKKRRQTQKKNGNYDEEEEDFEVSTFSELKTNNNDEGKNNRRISINNSNNSKQNKLNKNVLKSFLKVFEEIEENNSIVNYINKFDIAIDSKAFEEIIATDYNTKMFFDKAILANSVTFCEFNPLEKKQLVQIIKHYIKDIRFLSSYTIMGVGDGLNDVPMLSEVDIGVGINSKVNKFTSININSFSDIKRLIMFHGLNNLKRNTSLFELIIVKHFIAGIIFFIFGNYCHFSNTFLMPTSDVLLYILGLSIFTPFIKGIVDNTVYYYVYNEEMKKKDKEKDKNSKLYTDIYISSFRFLYEDQQQSMVECGTENIPYKKYISISYFIVLFIKSIIFCLVNFYFTYGATNSGKNIIDLSGNLIDFKKFQLFLWTNQFFIFLFEGIVFTNIFTSIKLIEIIVLIFVYLIFLILTEKQNTDQFVLLKSFLLFLTFFFIVTFCFLFNLAISITINLFNHIVAQKLIRMKEEKKCLREMKIIVDYREDDQSKEEEPQSLYLNDLEVNQDEFDQKKPEGYISNEYYNNNDYNRTESRYETNRIPKTQRNIRPNDESKKIYDYNNDNFISQRDIRDSSIKDSISQLYTGRKKEARAKKEMKNSFKYVYDQRDNK